MFTTYAPTDNSMGPKATQERKGSPLWFHGSKKGGNKGLLWVLVPHEHVKGPLGL